MYLFYVVQNFLIRTSETESAERVRLCTNNWGRTSSFWDGGLDQYPNRPTQVM